MGEDLSKVMPPLSREEYAALMADIQENGVQVPVIYDESGNIIDGHHRVEICQEIGINEWPRMVVSDLSGPEKRAYARRVNMTRRHLTQKQKREIIKEQLRDNPEFSDRRIGRMLGVDGKTVGSVREKLEETAEIPQLEERIGIDGKERSRRANKKRSVVHSDDEMRDLSALHRRAESGDELAQELLKDLDEGGTTLSNAMRRLKKNDKGTEDRRKKLRSPSEMVGSLLKSLRRAKGEMLGCEPGTIMDEINGFARALEVDTACFGIQRIDEVALIMHALRGWLRAYRDLLIILRASNGHPVPEEVAALPPALVMPAEEEDRDDR